MEIRFGISFDGFVPFGEAMTFARDAVTAGACSLWMAEHMGYREALVSCMAFALAAEKAMVVPTAVSPYLWHPTPTAMALATMAEAAPGQVGLAVGVGNPMFLQESGAELVKPVRAVREYIECLRALWTGEPVHHQGLLYRLKGARMAFRPPEAIPIYIAAIKEQMLRLAGRIGDGVVLSAALSAQYVKHSLDISATGTAKEGRDPSAFRKAGYLFFAASKTGKDAIETLRSRLAFTLRNKFLDDNIAFTGIPIDQEAIIEAVARRDIEQAARYVPDEAVEAFTVGGTPHDCRRRLEAYLKAGISEPVLMIVGDMEQRALSLDVAREFMEN